MGWYDDLSPAELRRAYLSPAGLAIAHTRPFGAAGQRWKLFPYFRLIEDTFLPVLLGGGKGMLYMPPRHGKSRWTSIYTPAWHKLRFPHRNVMGLSYGEDLAAGFSERARDVVSDMGHLFGVRLHPKHQAATDWRVQYLVGDQWNDGGDCYAAGVNGAIPGRGADLLLLDDVVRGETDTTPAMMQKVYGRYRSVIETRQEPGCATMLTMTRWACADLGGRLLEDEPDAWTVLTLPALAKEDDPLGRAPGEALCPERYSREWLERKRDSSDEGGLVFASLYQQEPLPDGGLIFRAENLRRWEGVGEDHVRLGNATIPIEGFLAWFVTIDPALKEKQANDPTGVLVWALTTGGELVCMEDHTARMRGSDDLIPCMQTIAAAHPGILFFVEEVAHGTEVIRACQRQGLHTMPLEADKDKVTRAIGAQPAFAAGKVWIPAHGAEALVRELLEFPTGRHDDRVDCVSYAVRVYHDRMRYLHHTGPESREKPVRPADPNDIHPDERDRYAPAERDRRGHWLR